MKIQCIINRNFLEAFIISFLNNVLDGFFFRGNLIRLFTSLHNQLSVTTESKYFIAIGRKMTQAGHNQDNEILFDKSVSYLYCIHDAFIF